MKKLILITLVSTSLVSCNKRMPERVEKEVPVNAQDSIEESQIRN